jgi:hypothetical protein
VREDDLDLASRRAAAVPVLVSANLMTWMCQGGVDVLLLALTLSQKDAIPLLEKARPDIVDVEIVLHGGQKNHSDFDHLLCFQV